jgi:hypothetical protein
MRFRLITLNRIAFGNFFNVTKQKGFTSKPKDRCSSLNKVNQISNNLNTYLMCNNMSNLDYLTFGYIHCYHRYLLFSQQRTKKRLKTKLYFLYYISNVNTTATR